jgi:5'-3' exonuclease
MAPGNPAVWARDAADVRARLGVEPPEVPMWKALAGDASDNIPGVTGIGAKTAATLVNRYHTLDALYDNLDELPARVSRALAAQRETAYLFLEVVRIQCDLSLPLRIADVPRVELPPDSRPRQILEHLGYP